MTVVEAKPLYHPPFEPLDFQVQFMAECYLRNATLVVADTGLGKGQITMGSVALQFEDGVVDHVLLCCEQNKVEEWESDFAQSTDLTTVAYYGPKRKAILGGVLPQVLISTYETFRGDIIQGVKVPGRKTPMLVPHLLGAELVGKRVLVVFDEISAKLGSRNSTLYKNWSGFRDALAKVVPWRAMALDATPLGKNPEGYFNVARMLDPVLAGSVEGFYKDHVASYDNFGNPQRFRNLEEGDPENQPWVTPLATKLAPLMLRKRKTDDDVRHLFPTPNWLPPLYVGLGERHQAFYEVVRDTFSDSDDLTQRKLFVVMRQIAGHPLALLASQSEVANIIVDEVGESGLRALGAAKVDVLIEEIKKRNGQQLIVFSFFGKSMFPHIQPALEAAGITCNVHTGAMTKTAKDASRKSFRAGDYQVFLTSDTGTRGINLPEAFGVIEYDVAITYSNQIQRFNRASRLGTSDRTVDFLSMVAIDTVEEGIANGVLRRADWNDALLEDEDAGENFITAEYRRALFRIGRERAK